MQNINILIVNDHLDLTKLDYSSMTFSGGERHIQFNDLKESIESPLMIIDARIQSSTDLIDLSLIFSALDPYITDMTKVMLFIPYMPYARQDRRCAEGQAHSMEFVAKMLAQLTFDELVVYDIHSEAGLSTLRDALPDEITLSAISQSEIIKEIPELVELLNSPDALLISPDQGAYDKCLDVHLKLCDSTPLGICGKTRDPKTGKITGTTIDLDYSDIKGKDCVIIDDICDSGYTFICIGQILKAAGAKSVTLYVTHGIFSKGLDVFDGSIDFVYTTTSINQTEHPKLHYTPIRLGE